jgi:hypothetical protein
MRSAGARIKNIYPDAALVHRRADADEASVRNNASQIGVRRVFDGDPPNAAFSERLRDDHLSPRWMLHPQPIGLDGASIEGKGESLSFHLSWSRTGFRLPLENESDYGTI